MEKEYGLIGGLPSEPDKELVEESAPVAQEEEKTEEFYLDDETLADYVQKAKSFGMPKAILDEAQARLDRSTCKTYNDFATLVNQIIHEKESRLRSEEQSRDLVKKAVEQEVRQLKRKRKSLIKELSTLIRKVYNTTAVDPVDLLFVVSNDESYIDDLKLDLYEEPVYSVYLQIEEPFIEHVVQQVNDSWKDNEAVAKILHAIIDRTGKLDPNSEDYSADYAKLIAMLPDAIKDEDSPDEYKAWAAMRLLLQQNIHDPKTLQKYIDKVNSEKEARLKYLVNLDCNMEDGIPYQASTRMATESMFEFDREVSPEMFTDAFVLDGEACTSYEDMQRKTFGEEVVNDYVKYKDDYTNLYKVGSESAQKTVEAEPEPEVQTEVVEDTKLNKAISRIENKIYEKMYAGNTSANKDALPKPPLGLMAIVPHVFLAGIIWLLFGDLPGICSLAGLSVATYGLLQAKKNEPKAPLMVGGGYGLALLGIILL